MKGCARFLAAICLALFVVSAVIALLLVNIRSYFLSPETFSQAFGDAGVYEELPEIAADQLLYGMTFNPCLEDPALCEGEGAGTRSIGDQGGMPSYFANLPEGVWESILTELIDPSWLEEQTESILEQVFSILTEESPTDAIVISMVDLKDRIHGDGGYQAVLNALQAQPDCTVEQMQVLTQAFASQGLSDTVLNCRPPADVMTSIEPYIRSGLFEVGATLPDNVEIEIPAELRIANSDAVSALSIARAAFRYAPWIALFWLLAVTVFVVRDVGSWLGWWGPGLFMAGLAAMLMGAAFDPLLSWSLDRLMLSQGPIVIPTAMMELALKVVDRMVTGFSNRMLAQAGLMLGIGLLMLIVRFITGPRSRDPFGAPLTEPRS